MEILLLLQQAQKKLVSQGWSVSINYLDRTNWTLISSKAKNFLATDIETSILSTANGDTVDQLHQLAIKGRKYEV